MLIIDIPDREVFDSEKDRFYYIKGQTLKLEHSLLSISKWESNWEKPFLINNKKSKEELLDYIRCMVVNQIKDPNIIETMSPSEINKIIEYIESSKTATTVNFFEKKKYGKQETVTSELIYYWMIEAQIPFECEKWHINRLFALLKICSAKAQPKKKGFDKNYARMQSDLNAQRRAKLKSKG